METPSQELDLVQTEVLEHLGLGLSPSEVGAHFSLSASAVESIAKSPAGVEYLYRSMVGDKVRTVKELRRIRGLRDKVVGVLEDILDDEAAKPNERLKAVEIYLDREPDRVMTKMTKQEVQGRVEVGYDRRDFRRHIKGVIADVIDIDAHIALPDRNTGLITEPGPEPERIDADNSGGAEIDGCIEDFFSTPPCCSVDTPHAAGPETVAVSGPASELTEAGYRLGAAAGCVEDKVEEGDAESQRAAEERRLGRELTKAERRQINRKAHRERMALKERERRALKGAGDIDG
jgi:hypothetical protein